MTISKDRVRPSPIPDSWKLSEIFTTGIMIGGYLAVMTVVFFWLAFKTDFFAVKESIYCYHVHICIVFLIFHCRVKREPGANSYQLNSFASYTAF